MHDAQPFVVADVAVREVLDTAATRDDRESNDDSYPAE
jgi:hypothetical protein